MQLFGIYYSDSWATYSYSYHETAILLLYIPTSEYWNNTIQIGNNL